MDHEEVNPCDHLRERSESAVETVKQRDTGGTRAQADFRSDTQMRGNNQPREVQTETMASKSEADADMECLFKMRKMRGPEHCE